MQRQKVKSAFFVLQRLTQRRGDIGKDRCPRDKCTDHPRSSIPEDWVVEALGYKLATHHPVIEPVSEIRVRNGIFRCRDRKSTPPRFLEDKQGLPRVDELTASTG